jgi:hypothetical protein
LVFSIIILPSLFRQWAVWVCSSCSWQI